MKQIGVRLFFAFMCIIFFLIIQGVVAFNNTRWVMAEQALAQEKQFAIKSLQKRMADLRLVVLKIASTMDPYKMDQLKAIYENEFGIVAEQLQSQGVQKDIIKDIDQVYQRIIWLQYNFAENMARALINTKSEQQYEQVLNILEKRAKIIAQEVDTRIAKARSKATQIIVGLCIAALITAFSWAVVLMRTLTDRGQAERIMHRLKTYLQDVIDSMPSVIVSLDTKLRINHFNLRAEELSGKKAYEVRGMVIMAVFPFLEDYKTDIADAIKTDQPTSKLQFPCNKDGMETFCDLTIYPLMSEEGGGAVIRIDDVSERVRLNEVMIQTEKMISVGGLAAGMAHEINNPLGIMMQSSQNILRRLSENLPGNKAAADKFGLTLEQIKSYSIEREILNSISDIRAAGMRAAGIMKSMLQFSRKSEILFENTNLNDLIEKTIELASHDYDLKKKFDFRQVEITRNYDLDLPFIPLVRTEMEQVIFNLLKNGAQAMAETQGEKAPGFIIKTSPEKDMVKIMITDNGPGIPEAVRKRIFEPFFTTKPVGSGTGLGLSVSYMIVTGNHKGRMTVSSEPGFGATFTILLPLEQSA